MYVTTWFATTILSVSETVLIRVKSLVFTLFMTVFELQLLLGQQVGLDAGQFTTATFVIVPLAFEFTVAI